MAWGQAQLQNKRDATVDGTDEGEENESKVDVLNSTCEGPQSAFNSRSQAHDINGGATVKSQGSKLVDVLDGTCEGLAFYSHSRSQAHEFNGGTTVKSQGRKIGRRVR